MPPKMKTKDEKNEDKMNKLIVKFQPKSLVIAQTDIVGYRFDEKTKTLHFLSQENADDLTAKKVDWVKIDA